jgi:hypothetical protein
MAKFTACLVFSAVCVAAPAVQAQDFGKEGQIAISAERLFGIAHTSQTDEIGDGEFNRSHTSISLLTTPFNSTTPTLLPVGFSFPRVGGDYFVIDGLSLGGSLGVFTMSGEFENEVMGETQDGDTGSVNGFLLAPRVGYAFMFSDTFGIWPRGGITFLHAGYEAEDNDEGSSSVWALTIEAPLVIAPLPHVAFTVGPTLDLGVTGSTELDPADADEPTVDNDFSVWDLGLHAGMTVYF